MSNLLCFFQKEESMQSAAKPKSLTYMSELSVYLSLGQALYFSLLSFYRMFLTISELIMRKWIDTCCIDKSSSAELSEAINSMFGWYERAEVCYAYLSDVPSASADPLNVASTFRLSKWFTRGWTLQELLAPYYVDFFDQSWNWIGSKTSLDILVREMTGIGDLVNYKKACVAQKMSWASWRETTRMEDQAYSLLGLFGVHMPTLYGEGENAFIRLQLEIINRTDDDSILAWDGHRGVGRNDGLLAVSPKAFAGSSSIVRFVWDPSRPPHTVSSKGLCVHLPLIPTGRRKLNGSCFLAPLNCLMEGPNGEIDNEKMISLSMYQSCPDNMWHREHRLHMFYPIPLHQNIEDVERTILYVPQITGSDADNTEFSREWMNVSGVRVSIKLQKSLFDVGFGSEKYLIRKSIACWEMERDNSRTLTMFDDTVADGKPRAAIVLGGLESQYLQKVGLVLGTMKGRPWIDIVISDAYQSMEQILDPVQLTWKLLLGRDRVSRPFLHGSLNARLMDGFRNTDPVVEMLFDPEGRLRWPVRDT